jgi:hypothetical protein
MESKGGHFPGLE